MSDLLSRRRFLRRASALAALGIMPAACSPSVEAEFPDLEVVQPQVQIPGAPVDLLTGEPFLSFAFPLRPPSTKLPRSAYEQVLVRSVSLTVRGGVSDFGFVETLRLSLSTADAYLAGTPGLEIAAYERPGDANVSLGPTLVIPRSPPVDVVDSFRAKESLLLLEISGDVPSAPWTVDVSVRLSARLKYA